MFIKVLDRQLIRRFNNSVINVDTSIGNTLISRGLAVLIENKVITNPPEDKMVKSPEIKKDESFIFGELK